MATAGEEVELHREEGEEAGPARRRGRKGVKTSATVKFNKYDRTFHGRHALVHFPDEADVPYSLNKAKRWQQVEEVKEKIAHAGDNDGDEEAKEGRITEVLEVKAHLREQVGSLSLQHRGQIPRHGFSGGGFYKEKRGRDYTRVEVVVCAECGNEAVFPPHDERPLTYSWKTDPEELARQRRERKAKLQQEKERRQRRKQQRQPKIEKKDLRANRAEEDHEAQQDAPESEEDEEEAGDAELQAQGSAEDMPDESSEDDDSAHERNEEEEGDEDEDDEDDEYVYFVEVTTSDEDDVTSQEEEQPRSEEQKKKKEADQERNEEDEHEVEEGEGSGAKVLKSQERLHVKLKEGRIVVQQPFEKGQYPMYRETNWKYSGPCMGCLHSQGKTWIKKGMGDKSKGKTKGFCKIRRRDVKLALKGEA